MSFRDSEFVQNEIKIINALQDRLAQMTMAFPQLSPEERDEYVQIVEDLLKKQRILWARVELCQADDPVAKTMANDVRKVMDAVGIPKTVSVSEVFNNIDQMIEALKKTIEAVE
tara:strand:- start:1363 stop:1704 length:342 start_codon:yes stop_codon:yes gene_type:complete